MGAGGGVGDENWCAEGIRFVGLTRGFGTGWACAAVGDEGGERVTITRLTGKGRKGTGREGMAIRAVPQLGDGGMHVGGEAVVGVSMQCRLKTID